MSKSILLTLAVMLLSVTACVGSGSSGSGGSSNSESGGSSISGSDLDKAERCVKIDIYKCSDRPRATVTNKCDENIWMAEILISAYAEDGTKIDADEEYVEDLRVGDDQDIEVILGLDKEGKIHSCDAEIQEVVFK